MWSKKGDFPSFSDVSVEHAGDKIPREWNGNECKEAKAIILLHQKNQRKAHLRIS